jgi:hypothetical protein
MKVKILNTVMDTETLDTFVGTQIYTLDDALAARLIATGYAEAFVDEHASADTTTELSAAVKKERKTCARTRRLDQ